MSPNQQRQPNSFPPTCLHIPVGPISSTSTLRLTADTSSRSYGSSYCRTNGTSLSVRVPIHEPSFTLPPPKYSINAIRVGSKEENERKRNRELRLGLLAKHGPESSLNVRPNLQSPLIAVLPDRECLFHRPNIQRLLNHVKWDKHCCSLDHRLLFQHYPMEF